MQYPNSLMVSPPMSSTIGKTNNYYSIQISEYPKQQIKIVTFLIDGETSPTRRPGLIPTIQSPFSEKPGKYVSKSAFKSFGEIKEDQPQKSDQSSPLKLNKSIEQQKRKPKSPKHTKYNHLHASVSKCEKHKREENCLLALALSQGKDSDKLSLQASNDEKKKLGIYDSQCYIYGNTKNLEKSELKISKSNISIGPMSVCIEKIVKVKIFPANICREYEHKYKQYSKHPEITGQNQIFKENCEIQKQNLLKLTIVSNVITFSQRYPYMLQVQSKESKISLTSRPVSSNCRQPLPFVSYAKIILRKLKQMYPSLFYTSWSQPTYRPSSLALLSLKKDKKMPENENFLRKDALIHGHIYKKSKHRDNWEKRYIIINQEGIFSFKSETDEKFSIVIEASSIKYLWTWFSILKIRKEKTYSMSVLPINGQEQKQIDREEKFLLMNGQGTWISTNESPYLVIKIKHGFNSKTQFAIPICGFDNQQHMDKNWLFAFYKIMSQYQY